MMGVVYTEKKMRWLF